LDNFFAEMDGLMGMMEEFDSQDEHEKCFKLINEIADMMTNFCWFFHYKDFQTFQEELLE